MSRLPPAALRILRALCTYHYLTKPQMVELGLAASVASLDNHAMPRLMSKDGRKSDVLCQRLTYGLLDSSDTPGKNHYMYYLTQAGLDRAYWEFENELQNGVGDQTVENLWIPAEHDTLSNDYHHRRHYVSAHIAIREWAAKAGATIDFWQHYYQADPKRPKIHGRPPSRNRVAWDETGRKSCTPDGLIGITRNGQSRIYIFELHHRTPTKLVVEQLYRDFRAARGVRNMFPDYPTSNDPYVLSVFTNENEMATVEGIIGQSDLFSPVVKGLRFRTVANLRILNIID